MPRYVAFLRAINVGGHVVKMDRLKALFEELRFGKVETFIASGNVLFDTSSKDVAALEQRIEKHLAKALGYEVDTFVRPLAALKPIAESHPFATYQADGHNLWIGFVKEPPSSASVASLKQLHTDVDEFHVHDREVYWLCRLERTSESTVGGKPLQKAIAQSTTFRNVTTVLRLAAKA